MDLPLSLAGLLASMFSFSGTVGQPLFGHFSDPLRKGGLIALGPIGVALITLLVYMPNYASMLLLLFIAGAGAACFHPVASVIASKISGRRKGFGISVYVAGGRIGVGLGAALSTFLVTTWGLESIPLGSLLGVAVGMPFFFIAPKIKNPLADSQMDLWETIRALS